MCGKVHGLLHKSNGPAQRVLHSNAINRGIGRFNGATIICKEDNICKTIDRCDLKKSVVTKFSRKYKKRTHGIDIFRMTETLNHARQLCPHRTNYNSTVRLSTISFLLRSNQYSFTY